ncbi:hypothetical protein BJ546DRAFT_976352 [Cryomyces antarcticus]|nr:hypothetical protein LTR04_002854 [Oleoguttula sp. CCFEE 6159]
MSAYQSEYCPPTGPLDPALFAAIVSDYDLHNDSSLRDARKTLDAIKAAALEEESTDFDPSGSSAYKAGPGDSSPRRAGSSPESRASPSEDTDLTSLSNGLSSTDLRDASESETDTGAAEFMSGLEQLDDDTKRTMLKEMFPSAIDYTISHTLRKCGNNWARAMEELLNHVYFDEAATSDEDGKIATKGIEAFCKDDTARRGRKTKAKKRRQLYGAAEDKRSSSLPGSASTVAGSTAVNKWETAGKDIEFICTRTGMSTQTVSSLYHKNGASVPATIAALLELSITEDNIRVTSNDPVVQANAFELGQDFPNIAPAYLTALIRLTHPSSASAHELAKALTTKPTNGHIGNLQVIMRHAPLDLSTPTSSPFNKTPPALPPIDFETAASLASSSSAARHAAFTQAAAAHRRGKSDHLMAAAAGYYSSLGRDADARLKAYSAAAADALVTAQSSATQLDLHGVTVKDATRIARERVTAWWVGLGESRVGGRAGIGTGFRIVTGVGHHSEGGRSKIGPAVGKMLIREGWKVEAGSGVLVVTGVVKRK